MAKATSRKPYALEMKADGMKEWFHLDAFSEKDRAGAELKLAKKRAGNRAEVRIRDIREK